jgi:hypothetical protein
MIMFLRWQVDQITLPKSNQTSRRQLGYVTLGFYISTILNLSMLLVPWHLLNQRRRMWHWWFVSRKCRIPLITSEQALLERILITSDIPLSWVPMLENLMRVLVHLSSRRQASLLNQNHDAEMSKHLFLLFLKLALISAMLTGECLLHALFPGG